MQAPADRLTAIVEEALLHEDAEREAFVRRVCGGDADLERAVHRRLADVEQSLVLDVGIERLAAELIDNPSGNNRAMMRTPVVATGSQLGAYRIESPLGAGGMGEVYRATDTVLGRQVAIKFLPEHLAADGDRLARFAREARVLASLNHPHIAAIYSVESLDKSGASMALVLELVEGPTLADRLRGGPLPVDEALDVARQIAEALEGAHHLGIVHRDLKPANIKVRDDGTVKVLDFGLAKFASPGAAGEGAAMLSPMDSPTITTPAMTAAGILLGTAAYMSPEQAKGRPADKRSDLWAFGCVLYEMLTGRRTFDGEDVADVLSGVLRAEPDWNALPRDLPAPVRTLLRGCLEKDHRQRIGDVAAVLFVLKRTDSLTERATAVAPTRRRAAIAWALGAAALAATVTALAAWQLTPEPVEPIEEWKIADSAPTHVQIDTVSRDVAILPDGSGVVYKGGGRLGTGQLYLRRSWPLEPIAIVPTGSPRSPFASPDGRFIGYIDSRGPDLHKVSVSGGATTRLGPLDGESRGASWGEDDRIVFATANGTTGLQSVSAAAGGTVDVLTRPNRERGEADHLWPHYLPGARAIVFTITYSNAAPPRLAVLDLGTRQYRDVLTGGSHAAYTATGHLVYLVGTALWAVPFDLARRKPDGTAAPLQVDVAVLSTGAAEFDVSRSGGLAFVPVDLATLVARMQLVWVDRSGNQRPLNARPGTYIYPRLSQDRRRVLVDSRGSGSDLWMWNLENKTWDQLTDNPGTDRAPLWLRDGRVAIGTSSRTSSTGAEPPAVLILDPDRKRGERRIAVKSAQAPWPTGVDCDGRILFTLMTDVGHTDVMIADPATGQVDPLLITRHRERNAIVSPDCTLIAYESERTGTSQVYIARYPQMDNEQPVSAAGGLQPLWSHNGTELFFVTADGKVWVAPVQPGGASAPGPAKVLFTTDATLTAGAVRTARMYDVAKNGDFLMVVEPEPETPRAHIRWRRGWLVEQLRQIRPTN